MRVNPSRLVTVRDASGCAADRVAALAVLLSCCDTQFSCVVLLPPLPPCCCSAPVSEAPSAPEPRTVKVQVGIHMPTKPGQRVLLVGSHPVLGCWDVSQAFKAKWSEGHVWRACLELPANIRSIEFKAVLKSADAAVWERGR